MAKYIYASSIPDRLRRLYADTLNTLQILQICRYCRGDNGDNGARPRDRYLGPARSPRTRRPRRDLSLIRLYYLFSLSPVVSSPDLSFGFCIPILQNTTQRRRDNDLVSLRGYEQTGGPTSGDCSFPSGQWSVRRAAAAAAGAAEEGGVLDALLVLCYLGAHKVERVARLCAAHKVERAV